MLQHDEHNTSSLEEASYRTQRLQEEVGELKEQKDRQQPTMEETQV